MGEIVARQSGSDSVKYQTHNALPGDSSALQPAGPAVSARFSQPTATLVTSPGHPRPHPRNTSPYPPGPADKEAKSSNPQLHKLPQPTHPHPLPDDLPGPRRPLPGSSRQSVTPFGGKLPPISSLLPPASHYPLSASYPHPAQTTSRPLNPPAHPRTTTTPSHPHRPPPLIPPPLPGSSYHPKLNHPSSILPSVPPLPSTTGPFHDLPRTEYTAVRESALPLHRPFRCDICAQCFSRNHDLKRHRRVHVAGKPFQCPRCGKHFSRKDALKRHRVVKACTGDKSPSPSSAGKAVGEVDTGQESDKEVGIEDGKK